MKTIEVINVFVSKYSCRTLSCLNIFTSPYDLAPPAHTATRSADQESGSWVTSGHMTNHWKTSSLFQGTADDDE